VYSVPSSPYHIASLAEYNEIFFIFIYQGVQRDLIIFFRENSFTKNYLDRILAHSYLNNRSKKNRKNFFFEEK